MTGTSSIIFAVVILGFLSTTVDSFSVSVPPVRTVCRNMLPQHHEYKPQSTEKPYTVSTDVNVVSGGGLVEVTLKAIGDKKFKGYYLQGRDSKNSPIGQFTANIVSKNHSCGGIRGNAAHHANPEDKENIKVSWRAPKNYQGDVTFTATFVQNFVTIWSNVTAEPIKLTA